MRYSNYGLFDFVEDEGFQEWVMRPNKDLDFFWESFISNHYGKVDTIAKAREIILSISFKEQLPPAGLENEIFDNIISDKYTELYQEDSKVVKKTNVARLFINRLGGKVAIFLIGLLCYSLWMYMAVKINNSNELSEPVKYIERTLAYGQRGTYKLPDGTQVKMNSGASIKFPEVFSTDKREVFLQGEAFFDVAHNENVPFLIHTGQLTTSVLGTSFNINYSHEIETLEVAVKSGLVSITKHKQETQSASILLKPKEMAFLETDVAPRKIKIKYDDVFAWKDGILILDDSTLPEIFNKLERWYGLPFIYPDNIQNVSYSGGRFNNMPLIDVLEGLSFTLNFNYTILNDKVMIEMKKH